jgi:alcohol dehydrogenase
VQQLTLVAPRTFEWREVAEPVLASELAALVAPIAVASCDLDPDIICGRTGHGLPIAFGHEFVGEIVAVGGVVERFAVGDVVVVAFQISCGACDACPRMADPSTSSPLRSEVSWSRSLW